jgi:hypothetical protein
MKFLNRLQYRLARKKYKDHQLRKERNLKINQRKHKITAKKKLTKFKYLIPFSPQNLFYKILSFLNLMKQQAAKQKKKLAYKT